MRIAYFFQYYHNPDCASNGRHYSFLKRLARHHQVDLITTNIWQKRRITELFDWVPENVNVHALDVPYDNSMATPRRSVAFTRYGAGAIAKGLALPRPDLVFGVSPPLTAAWVAAKVAQIRRVPFVLEAYDLWPDFPIQMGGIRSKPLQQLAYRMEKGLYEQATHIVVASPDMEAHVRAKGIPHHNVSTLVHGLEFEMLDWGTKHTPVEALRHEYQLEDKKVVLYAGTFGRANNIPALIDLAERLRHREDICFLFVGFGYYTDALHQAAERLPNIKILPEQPRHRIFSFFQLATLSFICFLDLPVLSANSPAKLFDSLGCKTPVVVTNPGWTKQFVEQHQCGWYFPYQSVQEWVERLERLLDDEDTLLNAGKNGYRAARTYFDREQIAKHFRQLLEEAVLSKQLLPQAPPLASLPAGVEFVSE